MTVPRIAILGVYPPPFGGVANHVQRLMPMLETAGVDYHIYNAVSDSEAHPKVTSVAKHRRSWLPKFLLQCQESAIYVLSDRLLVWLLVAVVGKLRGKMIGLRLRNSLLIDMQRQSNLLGWLAGFAMRRFDLVVAVSSELVSAAENAGVDPARILKAPGFLPPSPQCMDKNLVNEKVWAFIEGAEPLIVANGRISWHNDEDLYGLDMMIELLARLLPDYPRLKLAVCFWHFEAQDQSRLDDLMRLTHEYGIEHALFLNTEKGVFVPLLKEADVFVRPTNRDGDANSIREALALGVEAVASDITRRPEGCRVHRNRDIDSFEKTVREVLQDNPGDSPKRELHLDPASQQVIEKYLQALSQLVER